MPSSDLIFIVGRQRSGTTVFRDLLVRHGAVNLDEIFHGDLTRPHRFFGFVRDQAAKDPQLVHPQHHPRLFREFIESERADAEGRKLAMDVKYFGLNMIPQHEDVDGSAPFIINFMRNTKAHVVHILRRNKLRVHVSEEISRLTGRWSAEKVEQVPKEKPRLTLDIPRTLQVIDRLIQQDERVTHLLDAVPMTARLHYDEMFDENGTFTTAVQSIATRVLECESVDPIPGNVKMNPEPLADLVENHDALADALKTTPHAWMLKDWN